MTEVMIHDVTNPPLAARFFAYSCLSGYEILAENDQRVHRLSGIINTYPHIIIPAYVRLATDKAASGIRLTDNSKGAVEKQELPYDIRLAALLAMIQTAEKLQPSGFLLKTVETKLLDSCRHAGYSAALINVSLNYAASISKQILLFARSDGYNRISNFPRYTPSGKEGEWYPTPPAYFSPVEPYFNTVRSFTLDSAAQFKPVHPILFSSSKKSEFYKNMVLNYKLGKNDLTRQQREIAAFWDCNPFAVLDNGHMLIGLKKISPGAHWLGITGIACHLAHKDFSESFAIHTLVALGLMDSFICCWDEKYRSNRIRPETAIRKYIDAAWEPLLQTPPFPEYLSGHSCISATSANILTRFFGENFSYVDNVEAPYGLLPRSFKSFKQAADEAGISRFYGGIHFKDAIDQGLKQGTNVGNWILQKLVKSEYSFKFANK